MKTPPLSKYPDAPRIVVTDSGLGGLSILAEIARRLEGGREGAAVSLIYVNACPEADRGYNRMPAMAERIRVFDRALEAMDGFGPNRILIACNTLSVLYEHTAHHARGRTPVTDIIGFGVGLMRDWLDRHPGGRLLIFGTPTTVEADTHRRRLIADGVEPARIGVQPCDRLAGQIERGPAGEDVRSMIWRFVEEAAHRWGGWRGDVAAALCCTHYGYSAPLFASALRQAWGRDVELLNPNSRMSEAAAADILSQVGSAERVEVEVVSRHVWSTERVEAISEALASVSPRTAAALRHYRHDPNLFLPD